MNIKLALLVDFLALSLVGLVDWLFPRIDARSRELFEDWWIHFTDLDHQKIGAYIAATISQRVDSLLGANLLGPRFIAVTIVLSQLVFCAILVWLILAWGLIPVLFGSPAWSFFTDLLGRLRHALVPLILLNTAIDLASIAITRHILRLAARSNSPQRYLSLIGLDALLAGGLALASVLFFSNFYFAETFWLAMCLLVIYLSFIPATIFLVMTIAGLLSQLGGRPLLNRPGELLVFVLLPLLSIAIFVLAWRHGLYISYLSLDFGDLTIVLLIAVSLTAVLPTVLLLALLVAITIVRLAAKPCHRMIHSLLLRLAESPKGALYFAALLLALLKDALLIALEFD